MSGQTITNNVDEAAMWLSCAVIEQAIKDATDQRVGPAVQADACDYLCYRMWEPDDIFGGMARECLPASARDEVLKRIGLVKLPPPVAPLSEEEIYRLRHLCLSKRDREDPRGRPKVVVEFCLAPVHGDSGRTCAARVASGKKVCYRHLGSIYDVRGAIA